MSFTVTLIAADALDHIAAEACADALRDASCAPGELRWIDMGSAATLTCERGHSAAREALAPFAARMDVVIADPGIRKLLIADMDSTMITVECIDELADYAGIKPQIAAITERAMRGEIDFSSALDERVALLGGLSQDVLAQCLAERVQIMPGARTLVQTMKALGARCVLVSGGFTDFAEPVANMIGFDVAIANRLEVAGGALTGRVHRPIVDAGTKLATLNAQCDRLGIGRSHALAVGDGANDIPMLTAAGLGIAYHAHPKAAAAADAAIGVGDLTTLLWAQHIPRREWLTPSA